MPVAVDGSHMSTHVDAGTPTGHARPFLPAYGPIDALLGFAVFYVFVDRATPTVVDVVTAALPGVTAGTVGFALAAALWFVLVVALLDQARRQLTALRETERRETPTTATEPRLLSYAALVLVGGVIAAWTFERAIEAGIAFIRAMATLEFGSLVPVELAVMVVFFVTFGVASWALDRLVIGGLRSQLAA